MSIIHNRQSFIIVALVIVIILLSSLLAYNMLSRNVERVYNTTTIWSTETVTKTVPVTTPITKTSTVTIVETTTLYSSETTGATHTYINGTVYGQPYVNVYEQGFSIKFTVKNDTMEVDVYVYDELAQELINNNLVPFHGDIFSGYVEYRVRETYSYGIVYDLSEITINKLSMEPVNVSSLDLGLEYKVVTVSGRLTSLQSVSSGILLYIDTGVDEVTVLLPNIHAFIDEELYNSVLMNLTPGVRLSVTGVVYLYKGVYPEVLVRSLNDIVFEEQAYTEASIAELPDYIGETVVLRNTVLGEIEYESGMYCVMIYDETGNTELYIDSSLFKSEFDPYYVGTGSKLDLVVYVDSANSVAYIQHSIIEPYPAPLLQVSMVNESIDGYTVVLKGAISDLYMGGSYVIFYLNDETGSIKVFMPGSVYNSLEHKDLVQENSLVTIAGYIDIYRGELELIPYTPSSVQSYDYQVPGEGYGIPRLPSQPPPPSSEVKLADLEDYVGEKVTVTVQFNSIDYDSSLYMYVLSISDDTGSAIAAVGSSIVREVIDPWIVGCDSTLEITGVVETSSDYGVYINVLEINVVEAVSPPTLQVSDAINTELGTIIIIENVEVVNPPTSPTGNWIFNVSDDTGSIKVFILSSVVENIPDNIKQTIMDGGVISLAGYLDEYRGVIELIVYTPTGITV